MKLPLLSLLLIGTILFSGCGTSNKFASSFGKRKYNKGYYWNNLLGAEPVASTNNQINTSHKYRQEAKALLVQAVTTDPINQITKQVENAHLVTAKQGAVNNDGGRRALPMLLSPIVNSIFKVNGGGRHETGSGNSGGNEIGTIALVLMIIAIIITVGALAWALSIATIAGFAIVYYGILLSGILDLIAIILALAAIGLKTPDIGNAYTVLITNLVILLLSLLLAALL